VLQVGDVIAFEDVITRLTQVELFRDLCEAYSELLVLGLVSEFPPLRFLDGTLGAPVGTFDEVLGLNNCGELWVLMLLLLPQHLRSAVAKELGEASISNDIRQAVRCPWALPLEALREALRLMLQLPDRIEQCAPEDLPGMTRDSKTYRQ
jgi:hypothetical protein